jgi:hypothetical protein
MYKIVIPSAGRPEMLRNKTLALLSRAKPSAPIHIIVPEEQVETYRTHLAGAIEHTLHGCQKGLTKQRQFGRGLFGPSDRLVFLDDDVERLREWVDGRLVDVEDLDPMVSQCFQVAHDCSAALWGVYPITNRDWQSLKQRKDKAYCVGAFYGITNDIPAEPVYDEAEDWARQLEILNTGGHTVRIERWGIQTRYWKGDKGGIQRTNEETERIYNDLSSRYSQWVKLVVKRNGKLNLRFKR